MVEGMDMSLMPIAYAWFLTLILQIIGWPIVYLGVKNKLIDSGWAIARVFIWVLVALLIWFVAHLELPVNTTFIVWMLLLTSLSFSVYILYTHRQGIQLALSQAKAFIIIEEILFLIGFVGLSLVRSFNPAILDLEKPMDAGFMASYLRATTLPAPDMWLAGGTINYYSFGHFLGSIMSRIWYLPISYSYNLLLGFIMGLTFILSFSLVANLIYPALGKKVSKIPAIVGGLIGSLLVTLGGNSHTFWYLLTNGNWQGYWYADATRFIDRTIHEFPSYSFVVSDLHAHVWSLPVVLTFLIIITLWVRSLFVTDKWSFINRLVNKLQSRLHPKIITLSYYQGIAIILGIMLGIFIMTSAWDAMIYSLLMAIIGLTILLNDFKQIKPLLISAALVISSAALTALPWMLHFESISEGVAIATEHTPLWQLFALWTSHIIASLLAVGVALYGLRLAQKSRQFTYHYLIVIALAITAWALLLLPELVFIKDIYTGHPRANTMFKLTYQAFIIMSVLGGWVLGMVLIKDFLKSWLKITTIIIISSITVIVLMFPYFSYRDYYGHFSNYQGINGYRWLYERYPDDYAAINWLNQNVKGQPTIIEAVGESYTDYNQVSAVTGLPAVLGWRVHEWLWRGGFDIPGTRTEEVKTVYLKPLSAESLNTLNQYSVEYVYVGAKEREAYPELDEIGLKSLGNLIYQQGNTYIIQRLPQEYSVSY